MGNEMYSIGKVEAICNVTKKALRHYDKMGILSPDEISDENGYRYYSKNNLLSVPMIKYYKQSGFKLEEIKEYINGAPYHILKSGFSDKIEELNAVKDELELKIKSVTDWYKLIYEAEMVMQYKACHVSVKYLENKNVLFLNQDFEYDYMDSIINIEFTNYIENINNAITGPVIIRYPSYRDKMDGYCTKMCIMQEPILDYEKDKVVKFGGFMVASCYHIGSHNNIEDTYKKVVEWATENGYICEGECYERYVTDYWTTQKADKFVTEVMIKIKTKQ